MKLGTKVWIHCKDEILGDRVVVLITGTLIGETNSTVTIAGGNYYVVISWENIVCLERREEDDVVC